MAAGAPVGRAAGRVLTMAGAGSGLEASRFDSAGFVRVSGLAGRDFARSVEPRSGTGAAGAGDEAGSVAGPDCVVACGCAEGCGCVAGCGEYT